VVTTNDHEGKEPQVSGDATASVTAALFGLDGFIVLGAADAGGELELLVETVAGPCGVPKVGLRF
jgi:hypothetical protein